MIKNREKIYSLGIDTTYKFLNLSLFDGENLFNIKREVPNNAKFLPSIIDEIIKEAKTSIKNIKSLGVVVGPGSFTGIRIGIATALGLKYGLGIALYGFSSLFLLTKYIRKEGKIASIIDAKRGEFYFELFEISEKIKPLCNPMILKRDEIGEASRNADHIVYMGETPLDSFPNLEKIEEPLLSTIASKESFYLYERGEKENRLEPLYIREPDAKVQF